MKKIPVLSLLCFTVGIASVVAANHHNGDVGRGSLRNDAAKARRDELKQQRKTTTCPVMIEYGKDPCNVDIDDQKVCGYEYVYTGGCEGTPITCVPNIDCTCNGLWDSLWSCTIDAVMSTTTTSTVCHDGKLPIDPNSLRGQRCDPSVA